MIYATCLGNPLSELPTNQHLYNDDKVITESYGSCPNFSFSYLNRQQDSPPKPTPPPNPQNIDN